MDILLIAPYYAPDSEVAAVRMVSLSEHLIKHKHKVTVLCFSERMLREVEKRKDLRTPVPCEVETLRFDLEVSKSRLFSFYSYEKQFKKIIKNYRNVIRNLDVILLTCGPFYTLHAVSLLSQIGVPVLLDFRDLGAISIRPLSENQRHDSLYLLRRIMHIVHRKITQAHEKKAIDLSAGVFTVSQIDYDMMKEFYDIDSRKLHLASNGFDEEKLNGIDIAKKQVPCFSVGIFGKFMYYSVERAVNFLKAVNTLNEQGIPIKVIHIGREFEWIQENIHKNNINPDIYIGLGQKDYKEGMSILGSVDCFAVEDTSPDDIGTKIYDYIYWNKPIIAATPADIPLAKLVETFEHGYVCETEQDMINALKEVIVNKYLCLDSHIDVGKYSRKAQNQIIEDVMHQVSTKRG